MSVQRCTAWYAIRLTSWLLIRNTQYAIRDPAHELAADTHYAIRDTRSGSRAGLLIRDTQYAIRNPAHELAAGAPKYTLRKRNAQSCSQGSSLPAHTQTASPYAVPSYAAYAVLDKSAITSSADGRRHPSTVPWFTPLSIQCSLSRVELVRSSLGEAACCSPSLFTVRSR